MTPDTVFELASITKQFTATGIMVLIEEGKVHLPNGPESWKGITIRHLFTHTSGLPGLEDGFKAARAGARASITRLPSFSMRRGRTRPVS